MAVVLFALAAGATLTIWVRDVLPEQIYEAGVCLAAAVAAGRAAIRKPAGAGLALPASLLALIGIWGFAQLALGRTVYGWMTLTAGLRMLGLAATGLAAWHAFERPRTREAFLTAVAWFGFLLSGISVVAYFTSIGKVLWIFPAPYPDVWGPFLSRNNFAQFLELAFPIAWTRGLLGRSYGRQYPLMAAAMLAAGLASASRAGAALLLTEAVVVFRLVRRNPGRGRRKPELRMAVAQFALAATVFGALAGAGAVWVRIRKSDPLEYRREIYRSALSIIGAHAWTGTGLGTFSRVYPAYASFDSGGVVEHAHSDWLEWAAEGGIGYAVAWAGLSIWLARPAIRSIWGVGVLALLLHALADYPFARFGVAAWAFLLAGAAVRAGPPRLEQDSRSAVEKTSALSALIERSRV